jgi:hypothetical protein
MTKKLISIVTTIIAATFATATFAADAPPFGYAQMYTLEVSDPAKLLAAMQKFRGSVVGKKNPSGVSLNQFMANGDSEATHSIIVTYPAAADMDTSRKLNAGTKEWAEASATFQEVAEFQSSGLSALLKGTMKEGAITSANPVSMNIALAVTDQAAFMSAIDKLWDSSAANAFPGNRFLVNVLASGESPATHAVVFQANDMATLLTAMQTLQTSADMVNYLKKADDFRSVVSRTISIGLWSSPIPSN